MHYRSVYAKAEDAVRPQRSCAVKETATVHSCSCFLSVQYLKLQVIDFGLLCEVYVFLSESLV